MELNEKELAKVRTLIRKGLYAPDMNGSKDALWKIAAVFGLERLDNTIITKRGIKFRDKQ